ncbi:hypothetical protein IC575_030005 [Cucumis melo]
MNEACLKPSHSILLGRPFLKTAKAIINVDKGSLSVEFDGDIVTFNIFESMRYPDECLSLCSLELHDEVNELSIHDEFFEQEIVENRELLEPNVDYALKKYICDNLFFSPQKLGIELKTLPPHLKYIFLGKKNTFLVIISRELNQKQEERLIEVLKKKKQAIGWTLDDIKGISPTFCMHRIILEEGAKDKIQPQRRLNPTLKEVVMKEVLKLKDVGIIYPVSDSTWVSPIHVVPKKIGMTVVKNDKGEMVPMQMQNGWRMCIDYRKLNEVTKKDHFPLPFLDQMVEFLAGRSYFCFLDGSSGFYQIPIACEDQKKTTFTCDYGTYTFRCMSFDLCNASGTFQRCMMSIFSDFIEKCIEVFMDDFTVYGDSFDAFLASLELILNRCIETNIVLNYEKCHFMVSQV